MSGLDTRRLVRHSPLWIEQGECPSCHYKGGIPVVADTRGDKRFSYQSKFYICPSCHSSISDITPKSSLKYLEDRLQRA